MMPNTLCQGCAGPLLGPSSEFGEFRGRGSDESELLETCDLVSCALPTADCVDVALDGRQPPSSSELEPAVPRWRG